MKKHAFAPPAFLIATLMIAFGFAFGPSLVSAQGAATPSVDDGQNHLAHIHNGTCDDLGDPAYPLNNVVNAVGLATPAAQTGMATPAIVSTSDVDLATSTTMVDASLDDLTGDDYAINVHLSPEQADVYIACGDISGDVENDQLIVILEEVEDSGFSGRADLTDNGDGTTTVFVTVMQGAMPATPVASPAS